MVDVGGESTRPGASPVTAAEELDRVLPVIDELASAGVIVSVDTSKPEVAHAAVEAGAEVVNDVTAASSPGMAEVMAASGVGVILMHMKGSPRTMQDDPRYDDVLAEVAHFLEERASLVTASGVDPGSVALDPGIGFGKTVAHNLMLIDGLGEIAALGHPVVLGASRKSFLGTLTGIEPAQSRDGATAVTTALGFERGARVFRVHDVLSSLVALSDAGAIVSPERWDEWSPD
jgi:dihydropteroate synthase